MYKLALVIGIYSYLIFSLGVAGLLYKNIIAILTVFYFVFFAVFFFKIKKVSFPLVNLEKLSNFSKILLTLIFIQVAVNFVGVVGPEISFDALWYHLTLPKLYLDNHVLFHIPGNLLYYSDMPKLMEMLYVGTFSFGDEILAKSVHFVFGILTLFAIFKLSRKFLSVEYSLLSCLIFYSSLVVSWISIAAYVDLASAFFETVAMLTFLSFIETKDKKLFFSSSVMLGLAITTKLISLLSLSIYIVLIWYVLRKRKEDIGQVLKNVFLFICVSVLIAAPWFIFSYLNTGNPVYPFFSIDLGQKLDLNIFNYLKQFIFAPDPINIFYLISLPLIAIGFKKADRKTTPLYIYLAVSLVIWFLTYSIGGSRFFVAYLGVFSILSAKSIERIKDKYLKLYLLSIVIFISIISIGYRGLANSKYLPVVLKSQSREEFLTKNLNFNFGDFYDSDNYFKENIKTTDKVLLYGFHNLYYVEFPFIDSSFVKKGNKFNYVATQNTQIPQRFSNWKLIHYNKTTNVKLYTLDKKIWEY